MPSNAYNYAAIATENPAAPGTAVPVVKFPAYNTFNGNATIPVEEDNGYMGARNTFIANDRGRASGEPEIGERLRPDDALGYYCFHALGSVSVTRNIPSTGLSYKHVFSESNSGLPTATILQGYNYSTDKAKEFLGAMLDNLEFKFSTKEAPTVTPKYKSDMAIYDVTEPTLTYTTTPSLKAAQLMVYEDDYSGGTIGTTPMAGFREATVTINNQVETDFEQGAGMGVTDKEEGVLKVEGTITRKYQPGSDTQQLWATGSSSGTTVSPNTLNKKLRFKLITTDMIETIYPWYFQLDILNADYREVKPTESGDGQRMEEISFNGALNGSRLTVAMELQSKVASYAYIP